LSICKESQKYAECSNEISCFTKIAGILTDGEIVRHGIIDLSSDVFGEMQKSLKPTTYDLRLGDAHYVFNAEDFEKPSNWQKVFIGGNESFNQLNEIEPKFEMKHGCTLEIPAYGSALIQLEEIVDTLTCAQRENIMVVGRFDLKLSRVNQALISQQATQVEPCYKGRLFCFLHNLSSQKILINYKDPIATIEFSYVSCFCNFDKRKEIIDKMLEMNKKKYRGEFCFEGQGIKDVRWFEKTPNLPQDCGLASFNRTVKSALIDNEKAIDRFIDSANENIGKELDKFIKSAKFVKELSNTVKEDINLKKNIIFLWLAIILTLLPVIVVQFKPLVFDVSRYDKIIEEMQEEIIELRETIHDLKENIN